MKIPFIGGSEHGHEVDRDASDQAKVGTRVWVVMTEPGNTDTAEFYYLRRLADPDTATSRPAYIWSGIDDELARDLLAQLLLKRWFNEVVTP